MTTQAFTEKQQAVIRDWRNPEPQFDTDLHRVMVSYKENAQLHTQLAKARADYLEAEVARLQALLAAAQEKA